MQVEKGCCHIFLWKGVISKYCADLSIYLHKVVLVTGKENQPV